MNFNTTAPVTTAGTAPGVNTTDAVGQLDGMTVTQVPTPPARSGIKAFFQDLLRNISDFFKSITTRTATVVNTDITTSNWSAVTGFEAKDSGNGGVMMAKVEGLPVVLKGGGDTARNEAFGASLAQMCGLKAPTTIVLTEADKANIRQNMHDAGVEMPERNGGTNAVEIAMERVKGTAVGDLKKKPSAEALAASFGQWLAFAAFIGEGDSFHGLVSGRGVVPPGINTGNYMFDPSNPDAGLTGIDQTVSAADTGAVIDAIKNGDEKFFMDAAQAVLRATGGDPDLQIELAEKIKEAAQQQLAKIGESVTAQLVDMAGLGVGGSQHVIDAVKTRLDQINA